MGGDFISLIGRSVFELANLVLIFLVRLHNMQKNLETQTEQLEEIQIFSFSGKAIKINALSPSYINPKQKKCLKNIKHINIYQSGLYHNCQASHRIVKNTEQCTFVCALLH